MWALKAYEMAEEQREAERVKSSVAAELVVIVVCVAACVAALAWVLWIPEPDRSVAMQPAPVDPGEAWRRVWNTEVEQAVQLSRSQCIYCKGEPVVWDLWGHVRTQHTVAEYNHAQRLLADAWHRRAGVQ